MIANRNYEIYLKRPFTAVCNYPMYFLITERSILTSRANLTCISDDEPLSPTSHLPPHDISSHHFSLIPLVAKRPIRIYEAHNSSQDIYKCIHRLYDPAAERRNTDLPSGPSQGNPQT